MFFTLFRFQQFPGEIGWLWSSLRKPAKPTGLRSKKPLNKSPEDLLGTQRYSV